MILILYSIILLYCLAIIILIYGFTKVNSFEYIVSKPITNGTKFSIVVPFRNENENLPILLESFSKLNYPMNLIEVILVDDDSEEVFSIPLSAFSVEIIKNSRVSNSPKKDAILTAIKLAKNDWIITTDADCVANENWLSTINNYIQSHDVSMIVGAVTYECDNSILHHFQQLDLASLQGATIGSFGIGKGFMCNGANFAYTKDFFTALNGFDGNTKIASGDDVFLLQKAMKNFPDKVHYLKSVNNIVSTKPVNDWKTLFYQRVRWASKTSSYQSHFGIGLGIVVFAGNLFWVIGIVNWFLDLIPLLNLSFLLLCKFSVDTALIYKANHFLSTKKVHYIILGSLFYPFFSVSVALYSLIGNYEWKGRSFSK